MTGENGDLNWEDADGMPDFGGMPVLFFHEDPEEKQLRIEGAKPPPESVRVPRIATLEEPELNALEYPLLKFGWEPWSQGCETQALARRYADWLNEIAAERVVAFRGLLEQAGAPVRADEQLPADLAALGAWVQAWFALVAEPYVAQGFIQRDRDSRLGRAWAAHSAGMQGYSRSVDALVGSLAHDLAFVVADAARVERPDLKWQPVFDLTYRRFLVTVDAESADFRLIETLVEFLVQAVARPRGTQGRELKRWFSQTLQRCVDRAVNGQPLADVFDAFPEFHDSLSYPRHTISRPGRTDPPAPAVLVDGVEAMRRAGWFDSVKLSSADVAKAALAEWRRIEHEGIPTDPAEMYWRLLVADGGRTWSEDVDAGVRPGDAVYLAIAESLSHLRLKGVRTLYDIPEDWTSRPPDLLFTLRGPSGKRQILIPAPGHHISAALFTGLNGMLPAEGPRLWFFDHGPPIGIVTRATQAERDALEALTGIRLDQAPPTWWAALAPVPEPADAESGQTNNRPARPGQPAPGRARAERSGSQRGRQTGVRASSDRRAAGTRKTAGSGRAAGRAAGTPTAQQVFSDMMRNIVAPALRELGFKGSAASGFSYVSGDYVGSFWTQKSRYSTKAEVTFWVHLGASHAPTNSNYWGTQLHALIPGNDSFSHWTIKASEPGEPVVEHLLEVFRNYGWPAIQAALDSPGYPPDPSINWPRSFPAQPSPAERGAMGPNLGPLAVLFRRAGRTDEGDPFADLADPDEMVRGMAAAEIGSRVPDDPLAIAALLNRLESDPASDVRARAARSLAGAGTRPEVRDALRAAAADDEDTEVRWAARYALRLAAATRPPGGLT